MELTVEGDFGAWRQKNNIVGGSTVADLLKARSIDRINNILAMKPIPDNKYMKRGREIEPFVIENIISKLEDHEYESNKTYLFETIGDFKVCITPDILTRTAVYEIKTTRTPIEYIPFAHLAQVEHYRSFLLYRHAYLVYVTPFGTRTFVNIAKNACVFPLKQFLLQKTPITRQLCEQFEKEMRSRWMESPEDICDVNVHSLPWEERQSE